MAYTVNSYNAFAYDLVSLFGYVPGSVEFLALVQDSLTTGPYFDNTNPIPNQQIDEQPSDKQSALAFAENLSGQTLGAGDNANAEDVPAHTDARADVTTGLATAIENTVNAQPAGIVLSGLLDQLLNTDTPPLAANLGAEAADSHVNSELTLPLTPASAADEIDLAALLASVPASDLPQTSTSKAVSVIAEGPVGSAASAQLPELPDAALSSPAQSRMPDLFIA